MAKQGKVKIKRITTVVVSVELFKVKKYAKTRKVLKILKNDN